MQKSQHGRHIIKPFVGVGLLLFLGLFLLIGFLPDSVYAQTVEPTPTPTPAYIPGPVSDSITNPYQRQISPSTLVVGQDITANIQLSGSQSPSCWGIPGKPVDVMLVYDISASAGIGPGSNWEATFLLTQAFLDQLARPIYQSPTGIPELSRVGLVSSRIGTLGVEPILVQSLTEDFSLLRNQATAITPGDDTNLAAGLQLASDELAKVKSPTREQAIVLMLHDNAGFLEMETAITQFQSQGIPIYLIINSLNIPVDSQLDLATAEQLTDDDKIFIDPTPIEMYDLFLSVTDGDTDTAAAAIQVIEELTPAGNAQIFNVTGSGGRVDGSRVIWDIGRLPFGDSLDLEYGFRLPGSDAVGISGGIVWLDCNGYPHSTVTSTPVGMTAVTEVTATPEMISAQPETEPQPVTNVPPITVTPDEVVIPGVDVPDLPDVPAVPVSPVSPVSGLLAAFPWWILLIPIILLLLWLLWRWWQGRGQVPAPPTIRPLNRPEPRVDPKGIKPVKPPVGRDVAHGWVTESFSDQSNRTLILRHQSSSDERNNMQIILQVADDKQTMGDARLSLRKSTHQDQRTGRSLETMQAHLTEWNLRNQRDYRTGVGKQMLEKFEQWAQEQQATEIIIPANLLNESDLLSTQGFQAQGDSWVKPLR